MRPAADGTLPACGDGTRFIFTPAAPLLVSTAYTLTVAGTDLAGNALAGLASFSFTTRGPPDVTAPTVSAFLPAGMGVAHDAGVTITFSERMDPGSVSLQLAPFVVLELPTFDSSETVATVAAPLVEQSPVSGRAVLAAAIRMHDNATRLIAAPQRHLERIENQLRSHAL